MAFNIFKMLGLERKAAPDYTAVTKAVRPFQSLTEIPTGAALNDIILAALKQGKGIGFGPEYAERTTSPLVATRLARWKEYEYPALTSELASRGLSRSTLGARDIGRAEAAKERDINEIIGQAYKEAELQKKIDQARYEQLGMGFTGAEAAQRGAYSAEDVRRAELATGAENLYRQEKEAERIQNLNRTIGLALSFVSPQTADIWNQYAMPKTTGISYSDLLDLAKQEKGITTQEKPSPFTSKLPFQSAYDFFKNMRWS